MQDPLALQPYPLCSSFSHVHYSISVLALLLWSYPSFSFAGILRAISLDRARVNLHSHFESRTINGPLSYRCNWRNIAPVRTYRPGKDTIRRYFSSAPRTSNLKSRLKLRIPSSHAIATVFFFFSRIPFAGSERCVVLKIYGYINIHVRFARAPFTPTVKDYKMKIDSGNWIFS